MQRINVSTGCYKNCSDNIMCNANMSVIEFATQWKYACIGGAEIEKLL